MNKYKGRGVKSMLNNRTTNAFSPLRDAIAAFVNARITQIANTIVVSIFVAFREVSYDYR